MKPAGGGRALPRWQVLACALLALANLAAALLGALQRVGTLGGSPGWAVLPLHGVLMMAGFFGSLIALERAAALHRGLWVPLLAALAGGLALVGQEGLAAWAWVLSALGLLGLYLWAGWRRAVSLPLVIEALGALSLLGAALCWRAGAGEAARWGWSLFLVLTIAGERRELMRLLPLPAWAARAFLAGVAACAGVAGLLALGLPVWADRLGWSLLGLLALWLLRFDIARHQWRAPAWAGHTAICLLAGYGWLLAAAVAGLAGLALAWHLLWLGFVLAMVFGHAPLMLPALAGLRPRASRWALLPLGLMGASLLLRMAAATHWPALWPWAGAGHVAALLLFGLTMAVLCRRQQARAQAR